MQAGRAGIFISRFGSAELNFKVWCIRMIDLVFYLVIVMALIQGWRKGLIMGLISVICGIIGLAAAVKLSAVVATHMKSGLHINGWWLPILAFLLVFILVILIIRWFGILLEKVIDLALLGWLNKLGGILLYIIFYLSVYSVILFYATRSGIISQKTTLNSRFYSLIAPFGPGIIRFITGFIPYGQDMFRALEAFFDRVAGKIR